MNNRKGIDGATQWLVLQTRATVGEHKIQLARDMGISRETLYQYLKRNG
jgi:DNA-binding phage protein